NICWYPLNYYQQDPHSRHYRHGDGYRHPGYGNNQPGRPDDPGRSEYKHWRGVTRVPRGDFGNPNRRGQGVDETIARRVLDREPDRENIPGRTFSDGRPGRQVPVINLPDRPTGAGDRIPGATLDDDLRNRRVFRGREPRHDEPRTPSQPSNGATPATDTQPNGAVNRPENPSTSNEPGEQPDRPGRYVRPAMPEGVEKRQRGQQAIENQPPRNNPQPRSEPRSEPRNEQPATPASSPESRPEPRPEPQPERRPEPRIENRPTKTFE